MAHRETDPFLPDADLDDDVLIREDSRAWERFPLRQVGAVGALIMLHVGIVLTGLASPAIGREIRARGALFPGRTLDEPWRLLSSLFLHADLRHVLWNGASMIVFAVPLLLELGLPGTLAVYLVAGAGGGIAASSLGTAGGAIIGSSGALAGLFGAWVVLTLRKARGLTLSWRRRVRTVGIALLLLPSLITPITASGRPTSVSSHLGGLATGMLLGALISSRLLSRVERRDRKAP